MGMVSVGDPCRKIVFGECATQTRHVLICLFGRATKGIQNALYELLRTGVVDITRLERRKDFNAPFDSQRLMCALRIERGERILRVCSTTASISGVGDRVMMFPS